MLEFSVTPFRHFQLESRSHLLLGRSPLSWKKSYSRVRFSMVGILGVFAGGIPREVNDVSCRNPTPSRKKCAFFVEICVRWPDFWPFSHHRFSAMLSPTPLQTFLSLSRFSMEPSVSGCRSEETNYFSTLAGWTD